MYLDADTDVWEIEQWVKKTAPEFSGSLLALASGETDPRKALDRLQTAANMLCPSRFIADLISAQGGQAYMYYFTRRRGGEGGELLGVYHGAELPYVFDQHDSWLPTDAIDRQLSGDVMDYWTAFARNGNPDSGGPPGWPVFTSTRHYVMELGDQVRIIQPDDAGLCKYLGPVR
jgi:para-nitrobenzyl esterase